MCCAIKFHYTIHRFFYCCKNRAVKKMLFSQPCVQAECGLIKSLLAPHCFGFSTLFVRCACLSCPAAYTRLTKKCSTLGSTFKVLVRLRQTFYAVLKE